MEAAQNYSRDDLDNKKYSELQKISKALGIKGGRLKTDKLIEAILEAEAASDFLSEDAGNIATALAEAAVKEDDPMEAQEVKSTHMVQRSDEDEEWQMEDNNLELKLDSPGSEDPHTQLGLDIISKPCPRDNIATDTQKGSPSSKMSSLSMSSSITGSIISEVNLTSSADDITVKSHTNPSTQSCLEDDNNGESITKKVKLEPASPSRVVHIRQVPNEATETDIIHMVMRFGKVGNILMLKGKNQALLEMTNKDSAIELVNHCSNNPLRLYGRQVFVQFSKHKELKTSHQNSVPQSLMSVKINPPLINQPFMKQQVGMGFQGMRAMPSMTGLGPMFQQRGMIPQFHQQRDISSNLCQQGAATILHVIVNNMLYPVTLDSLHQVFSKIGQVMKIVLINKFNTFQALVQYQTPMIAQAARLALNGKNIYSGCCTMKIEESKLSFLTVYCNNDQSRDYTNLASGENSNSLLAFPGNTGKQSLLTFAGNSGKQSNFLTLAEVAKRLNSGLGNLPGPLLHSPNPALISSPCQSLHSSFGGCVLLVSNLNEDKVTPNALFMLFGVYGDVQRVKILFHKKSTALIQMSEHHQCKTSIKNLDKIDLWDKQIGVRQSKHAYVQLPRGESSEEEGLTKDYTNSVLHRFKKPGSKNFYNIYPPSSTLHLSNIPESFEREQLEELFTMAGATVKDFKFFPNNRKMAIIQLNSTEEAIQMLIDIHNRKISDTHYLRVSFSKSSI